MSESNGIQSVGLSEAEVEAAWLARYTPVKRAILDAAARRREARARRRAERARAFGDLCEATEGRAVFWRLEGFPMEKIRPFAEADAWCFVTLMRVLRHEATRRIDVLRHRVERPLRYEAERLRRLALAKERRRVARRETLNPCPTREQVLEAWIHRKDSDEARLRLGSLLDDLACYLDSTLRRNEDGVIIGRNPGVKGWLRDNIPALAHVYSTLMRYKEAARKLRQVVELKDPVPLDRILGPERPAASRTGGGGVDENRITERTNSGAALAAEAERSVGGEVVAGEGAAGGDGSEPSVEVVQARAIYLEVVGGVTRGCGGLFGRIDAFVDATHITEANLLAKWKAKYQNEITVRTKTVWWKRLFRAS